MLRCDIGHMNDRCWLDAGPADAGAATGKRKRGHTQRLASPAAESALPPPIGAESPMIGMMHRHLVLTVFMGPTALSEGRQLTVFGRLMGQAPPRGRQHVGSRAGHATLEMRVLHPRTLLSYC